MAVRDDIIQNAQRATGNEPSLTSGDEQFDYADAAYERALPWVIELHPWAFAIERSNELSQGGQKSQRYTTSQTFPSNCVRVLAVFNGDDRLDDYEIVDRFVCCNFTQGIRIHYLKAPAEASWSPLFAEGFTKIVEGDLLRGLNEDSDEAGKRETAGLALLAKAYENAKTQAERVRPRTSAQGMSALMLGILNDALIAAGRNPNAEDGETGWLLAVRAFSRVIGWASEVHAWNFATRRSTDLSAAAGTAKSLNYSNSWALPSGCLRVLAVYQNGERTDEYEIVDNTICTDFTQNIRCHFLTQGAETVWSPAFVEGVTRLVEAEILRASPAMGDTASAQEQRLKAISDAESGGRQLLDLARTSRDAQSPLQAPRRNAEGMTQFAIDAANDVLMGLGLNPSDQEGSAKWSVARRGYDRAIDWLLEEHPWTFATKTSSPLEELATESIKFDHVYELPGNAIRILSVHNDSYQIGVYEIFGHALATNYEGEDVRVRYIGVPDENEHSHLFREAVRQFMEASVLRSIPERAGEAPRRELDARQTMASAKVRGDQQQPPRNIYTGGRVIARRRGARWPG